MREWGCEWGAWSSPGGCSEVGGSSWTEPHRAPVSRGNMFPQTSCCLTTLTPRGGRWDFIDAAARAWTPATHHGMTRVLILVPQANAAKEANG